MGKSSHQSKETSKPKIKDVAYVNLKAKSKINKNIKLQKSKQLIKNEIKNNEDIVKKHDASEIEQTLFVGNIPSNTKRVQLKTLFSQFGIVKTIRFRTADGKKIFKHKQRKDCEYLNAYVLMESKEAVEKALTLSGTEFKGRHIRVTTAKKSTENIDTKRVLFVGNLKYSVTDEKLFEIFSSCGELEYVRTIRNEKGCKGIAYVCFKKPESVTLGLELNNTLVDERPIRVERYSKHKLGEKKKEKSEVKQLTGPARRIKEKEKKKGNKLPGQIIEKKKNKKVEISSKDSHKKSDYRGVQIKKKKFKKKKTPNPMKILAKKIAPKTQMTKVSN